MPLSPRARGLQRRPIIASPQHCGAPAFYRSPQRPICASPSEKEDPMVEPLRMNITKSAPEAYRHLLEVEQAIGAKLDHKLHLLIKMRASQINGCAYCIGMHGDDAMRAGETPER